MFNSLDIDLYKDGYDIDVMDCIDIPIAAIAGFYQNENYYYYSMLFSARSNWGKDVFDDSGNTEPDYFAVRNKILNGIGLELNMHFAENKVQMLEIVKRHVLDNIPVMLITKYKSIFYYRYYMKQNGNRPHALIIDEWNSETSILRIRDSALMRDLNIMDLKADILFPLRLTDEMVANIWEASNNEFNEQHHIFSNSVYSMERRSGASDNSYDKIIEVLLSDCNFEDSVLARVISNFNNRIEYIKDNMPLVRRFQLGGLSAFFGGIERWLTVENCVDFDLRGYYRFKEEYLKFRNITLSKLHKYANTNRKLTDEEADRLTEKVKNYDRDLCVLIISFSKKYKLYKSQMVCRSIMLKLDGYCNNEGFAMSDAAESTADLTGKGVFFIASNLPENGVFSVSNMKMNMVAKKSDGQLDNVSCTGQEIDVEEGMYGRIAFLGCSEYGSYCEKVKLCIGQDIVEEIEIKMSDFFESPLFGEETLWKGKAAERTDAGINILDFNGRIFLSETNLPKKAINRIILPHRKNIHLFAITLVE